MFTTTTDDDDDGGEGAALEEAKLQKKGFKYMTIMPMSFFEQVDASPDDPNAFLIKFEEDVGTFVAPNPQERDTWIRCIKQAMDEKVVIDFDL